MKQSKFDRIRRATKWGKYPRTFNAIFDRLPESAHALPAWQIAELIDALQGAYQDGRADSHTADAA